MKKAEFGLSIVASAAFSLIAFSISEQRNILRFNNVKENNQMLKSQMEKIVEKPEQRRTQ